MLVVPPESVVAVFAVGAALALLADKSTYECVVPVRAGDVLADEYGAGGEVAHVC